VFGWGSAVIACCQGRLQGRSGASRSGPRIIRAGNRVEGRNESRKPRLFFALNRGRMDEALRLDIVAIEIDREREPQEEAARLTQPGRWPAGVRDATARAVSSMDVH
jgi:hypothetical protein